MPEDTNKPEEERLSLPSLDAVDPNLKKPSTIDVMSAKKRFEDLATAELASKPTEFNNLLKGIKEAQKAGVSAGAIVSTILKVAGAIM